MKYYEHLGEAMKNLSHRGAFLTTKNSAGIANTMTIGWGYVGYSWNKPYFVAMVRPQRYTREIIENADSFTISIPFDEEMTDQMRKALAICGSKSGRDTDKEEAAGIKFIDGQIVSSPVIEGCNLYYECKIAYRDDIHVEKLPEEFQDKWYDGDKHDIFYGEIVAQYRM